MKLSMKEKKILYAFACPSHHNTVTRLKWLTALTVDPEAKRRMLGLARKVETEMNESWYEDFYHHLRMEMDEYQMCIRDSCTTEQPTEQFNIFAKAEVSTKRLLRLFFFPGIFTRTQSEAKPERGAFCRSW